jgi:hypothetical protein
VALSWNEIKDRAVKFSKDWADTTSEDAEAKSFLDAFFDVFGISRKRVGTFEHGVRIPLGLPRPTGLAFASQGGREADHRVSDSRTGYIDLLYKGVILIEMKSAGKDLNKAFVQAKEYIQGLKESEVPKYILVCDFQNFRLYDTEERTTVEFKLADFVKNVQHFSLVAGYQKRTYKEQDPVNIKAAELLGKLHDRLKEVGYSGHPLEVFLVRLLFCLFAEDTTIFNKLQFQDYVEQRTAEDGSDLAAKLQELFQVLNTKKADRFTNLDEQLADFPYVNGKLFEETLPVASFDKKMRQALLDCCYLDWSKISPAIFGSMFQSVMNPEERRNLGAHYTSEKNILKLIKPLFLDELWEEFEAASPPRRSATPLLKERGKRGNSSSPPLLQERGPGGEVTAAQRAKLIALHKKISEMKFLDPACGCGNFLVIAYRELRLLEIEILKKLHKSGQGVLDVGEILWLDVDMMYGIEYEEFPARIAEVAMWLIDHQMNMAASEEFGQYFVRLPLKKAANIVHGNALRIDWGEVVPKEKLSYIMGNPPFVGSKFMDDSKRQEILALAPDLRGIGVLDYVTGWYLKAAQLIQRSEIKAAFVSTNSITQGEQVGILWRLLFQQYGIRIHFAHRTFRWSNEARGKAAVYVVIVGFAVLEPEHVQLFDYDNPDSEAHLQSAAHINPYLIDARDVFIESRQNAIATVPEIGIGNKPIDGGNYLFSIEERDNFIKEEPDAKKYFRKWIGSDEFINGYERWCLWIGDANPADLKKMPLVLERIEAVRKLREASPSKPTQKLASVPTRFHVENFSKTEYVVIPKVSSERRKYIPIGFLKPSVMASDLVFMIPDAKLYHFGVLTSQMHMAWVRTLCGRLKSDYRYSKDIVYNNFPWPENPTDKQVKAIETAAQKVLDVRAEFMSPPPAPPRMRGGGPEGRGGDKPGASLADLYDPLTMPPKLVKAHNELDKAVDLAYRPYPFPNDAKRMEWLFELYEKYTAGLFKEDKKPKKGTKAATPKKAKK